MKKSLIIILMCLCTLFSAFALQSTFGRNSSEYKDLMTLCNATGTAPANMVLPISADQASRILDSIDTSKLNDTLRSLYDDLRSRLESPEVVIDSNGFAADLKLEGAAQYLKQSASEFDFLVAKKDRKPMILLGADLHFNDNFFATFNIDVTDIDNDATENSTEGYKTYTTNFMKKLAVMDNVDFTFPHKAFASIGGNGMNLTIGRDRLSLGNGKTGNLVLGDTLWFHDFIKASVISGIATYDFTIMSFENTKDSDHLQIANDYTASGKRQMVFLHTFSIKPSSWLTLSLSEGALSYGSTILEDLRKLNPFFILHNVFDYSDGSGKNRGNMNNFFGFEASLALPYGFGINAQFVFDQIQLSGEKKPTNPQGASGTLVNITKSGTAFGGFYDAYIEGVYTTPNLYLKEADVKCGEYWNMDLIVGKKLYWAPAGNDTVSYLGYQHGPDSVVIGAGFDWRNLSDLEIKFSALYRIHGNQGIKYYASQNDKTITYGEDAGKITGEHHEKRLVLDLVISSPLTKYVVLEGEVGFVNATNYRNVADAKFSDIQFAISATIKFDELFNKTELN